MERLPAGSDASAGGGVAPYARHHPERTLLHQVVRDYYPAFKAHLAAQGAALPGYVEREFEGYLACGRPICLPQHGDHLLFGESTLLHGLLALQEPFF